MSNPKWEEQIIVVPRKELFANGTLAFQGVETDDIKVDLLLTNIGGYCNVMRRGGGHADPTDVGGNAEINFNLKQPITYAILKRGRQYFVYERLSGGGEERLYNQLSLGVGGHMNAVHGDFIDCFVSNLEREMNEEVEIRSKDGSPLDIIVEPEIIGFINDDLNEVGRVHLGILTIIHLPLDAEVSVRETDSLRGEWVDEDILFEHNELYVRLESWSQLAVDALAKL